MATINNKIISGLLIFIAVLFSVEMTGAAQHNENKKPSGIEEGWELVKPQEDLTKAKAIFDAKHAILYLGMLYAPMYPPEKSVVLFKEELELQKTLELSGATILRTKDGTALIVLHADHVIIVYGGLFMGAEGKPQALRILEGKELSNKYYGTPPAFLVAANYMKAVAGGARCHRGAYARFALSWDEIYSHIAVHAGKIGKPVKELYFKITGHSMGGAVAQLAALRLATLSFHDVPGDHIQVITFGPARLFDTGLVRFYHGKGLQPYTMAVLNANDRIFDRAPLDLGYATPGLLLTTPSFTTGPNPDPHSYRAYKHCMDIADDKNTTLGEPPYSTKGDIVGIAKNVGRSPFRCLLSAAYSLVGSQEYLVECVPVEKLKQASQQSSLRQTVLELVKEGEYATEQEAINTIGQGIPELEALVKEVWAQLHEHHNK
ncbi:MAG: hypothetical protein K2Y18_06855 [Alphaproteobacteria bacterium]|jgi:hypothetical protein|nr:hypothetical protein [Alphaproteobacteria bacterium]